MMVEYLPQPIMLAGGHLSTSFFRAAKDKGLRISTARTLQFAVNLLVDGSVGGPGPPANCRAVREAHAR